MHQHSAINICLHGPFPVRVWLCKDENGNNNKLYLNFQHTVYGKFSLSEL